MSQKDIASDHLNIWTWSTALGPVHGHHYPLDIFITPCRRKSWPQPERQKPSAKVAPWCQRGTSEFCVEIISLFRCHLASGCWHVAQARCSMGNTTESHLQWAHEWRWPPPTPSGSSEPPCKSRAGPQQSVQTRQCLGRGSKSMLAWREQWKKNQKKNQQRGKKSF